MRIRITDPGTVRLWIVPVLLTALLLTGGCSLDDPGAPSWEIELNVPLSNTTYDLPEVLSEENFTPVGPDSIYSLDAQQSIDPVTVTDEITIDGFDRRVGQSLGDFTVPAPASRSAAFQMSQIYAGPYSPPDVPVPPFTFGTVSQDLPPFDAFSQVTIASGTMTITVTNNTPVPLDSLNVALLDEGAGNTQVLSAGFASVMPVAANGGTGSIQVPLDGISMSGDLIVEVSGGTPGSSGNPVTISSTDEFVLDVVTTDLTVSSATARVAEIDIDHTESLDLDPQSEIHSVTFEGGTLQLDLDNQLPVDLDVTVEFPTLSTSGQSSYAAFLLAQAGQTTSETLDLSGWTLQTQAPGMGPRRVPVLVNFYSPGSGGSQVALASTDSVIVQAALQNLSVSEVTGVLDAETATVQPASFSLIEEQGNLLEELRKVGLNYAELEFVVDSEMDFPAQVDLDLVGLGGDPSPAYLSISFPISAGGTPGAPVRSTYLLDDTKIEHPALMDLINAFPTSVEYSGTVTVGDGSYVGSIQQGAQVSGELRFRTLVELTVNETLRFESDIQENREGLDDEVDRIQEATLTYAASTTTNMPMRIVFLAATDSNRVFSDPELTLELSVAGAIGTEQDTVVTLSPSDFDLLKNPVYTGVRVLIPPSGAVPYRVSKNDRLFLRAFGTVRVLVDPDDGQGGGGGR